MVSPWQTWEWLALGTPILLLSPLLPVREFMSQWPKTSSNSLSPIPPLFPLVTSLSPVISFFQLNHPSFLCRPSMDIPWVRKQLASEGSSLVEDILGKNISFRKTILKVTATCWRASRPRAAAPLAEGKLFTSLSTHRAVVLKWKYKIVPPSGSRMCLLMP